MSVNKNNIGVTHDMAQCVNCDWTSHDDVYSHDPDWAARDHVKFNKGHKVCREVVKSIHYTYEESK